MARGPLTFRQRDVEAMIRAAKAEGLPVSRVSVDRNGRIVVVTTNDAGTDPADDRNEWD